MTGNVKDAKTFAVKKHEQENNIKLERRSQKLRQNAKLRTISVNTLTILGILSFIKA